MRLLTHTLPSLPAATRVAKSTLRLLCLSVAIVPLLAATGTQPAPATQAPTAPKAAAQPSKLSSTPAQEVASTTAMLELGLALLRQQDSANQASDKLAKAPTNIVLSPFSLLATLGMIEAGSTGNSQRELHSLLGTEHIGNRIFHHHLPGLIQRLRSPAGTNSTAFSMANRIWVDSSAIKDLPASYGKDVATRFNADANLLAFGQADAARKTINAWVAQATHKHIPDLLPEGAITPNTKLVATNAIHFKSPWETPFDASQTSPQPFHTGVASEKKMVATMQDEREVFQTLVQNTLVMELPFAQQNFSLLIAMPTAGQSLSAWQADLEAADLAAWRAQLQAKTCRLSLPKFHISPSSTPMKTTLQTLGTRSLFGPDADFSPMLGQAGKGVTLDDVFQSATITIDERGGEAAAATGAVVTAKSFSFPAPPCVIDRPFWFAVLHRASGLPLFVGRVQDPSLPTKTSN